MPRFPCAPIPPPIPRWDRWVLTSLASPPITAFPVLTAGRLPHHPFRGLHSVHSRCGLRARRITYVIPYTEGSSRFVTSTTAPIATGGSESRRAGLPPAGKSRLFTAHVKVGSKSGLMITVSDGGAAGSPRASWLFMLASRTGQVLVRNPLPEKPATSAAYEPPSQKTGQVLVRTPGGEKARISAPARGYVRRSELPYIPFAEGPLSFPFQQPLTSYTQHAASHAVPPTAERRTPFFFSAQH